VIFSVDAVEAFPFVPLKLSARRCLLSSIFGSVWCALSHAMSCLADALFARATLTWCSRRLALTVHCRTRGALVDALCGCVLPFCHNAVRRIVRQQRPFRQIGSVKKHHCQAVSALLSVIAAMDWEYPSIRLAVALPGPPFARRRPSRSSDHCECAQSATSRGDIGSDRVSEFQCRGRTSLNAARASVACGSAVENRERVCWALQALSPQHQACAVRLGALSLERGPMPI